MDGSLLWYIKSCTADKGLFPYLLLQILFIRESVFPHLKHFILTGMIRSNTATVHPFKKHQHHKENSLCSWNIYTNSFLFVISNLNANGRFDKNQDTILYL